MYGNEYPKVLKSLATNILPAGFDAVLSAVQDIEQADVLSALATNVPTDRFNAFLAVTQSLQWQYQFNHAKVLIALTKNILPERADAVLSATQSIQDESARSDVLTALAATSFLALEEALAIFQINFDAMDEKFPTKNMKELYFNHYVLLGLKDYLFGKRFFILEHNAIAQIYYPSLLTQLRSSIVLAVKFLGLP